MGSPTSWPAARPSVSSAGTGGYLLTIASAAGPRGSAPCAPGRRRDHELHPRYQVAGVQFRLLELDVTGLAAAGGHDDDDLAVLATLGATQRHARLRNLVAAALLDSVVRRRALLDPFGGPELHPGAGAPGVGRRPVHLRGATGRGRLGRGRIDFVDAWAVRRPPSSAPDAWPSAFVGPRAGDTGLSSMRSSPRTWASWPARPSPRPPGPRWRRASGSATCPRPPWCR